MTESRTAMINGGENKAQWELAALMAALMAVKRAEKADGWQTLFWFNCGGMLRLK